MESITFEKCVKGAWRDGCRYVRHRPALVAVIFVIAWLAPFVETVLRPDKLPPFRLIAYIPLGAFELFKLALFSVLTVQAVRFVLLGKPEADAEPLISRNYWRYLGFACGLLLLFLAIVAIAMVLAFGVVFLLARHHIRSPILVPIVVGGSGLIAAGIGMFLGARLSLLCTQVAIGGAARVRDSWIDTRGHCWSIWMTLTVTVVPLLAVSRVVVASEAVAQQHSLAGVVAFGGALAEAAGLCVGAACSAWLYRRYARVHLPSPMP
jgi:hypothetical protein